MTHVQCQRCQRPTGDQSYVCEACAAPVVEALLTVPGLVDELPAAIWRQTRYGSGGVGGWQEPWDQRAQDAHDAVTNALTTVARDLDETGGYASLTQPRPPLGPTCRTAWVPDGCQHETCWAIVRPVEHPAALAALWLADQVDELRKHPDGPGTLRELEAAVRQLRRVVDRPRDRWWAGPCSAELVDERGRRYCGVDLYAVPGAQTITCRACTAEYDAVTRRDELLRHARKALAHAELVARALTALERPVTSSQIRGWAHRGRIIDHGVDQAGRPLYRVADVLWMLDEQARQDAIREVRREATAARRAARQEADGDAA